MDSWLINGVPGNAISVTDRGLQYGDGLFETLAVRDGQCRFLDAHLQRLAAGCQRLMIPAPDEALLRSELEQLAGTARHATLKIIVTRGPGPRGYRLPPECNPVRIIGMQVTQPVEIPAGGVAVRYCSTRIGRNVSLAGLKTLNRLEQVLARAEWSDNVTAEGLMLNDRDEVVCGTMTNLFCVRDGRLFTPRLDECGVSGIMRQQVLAVAARYGIDAQEAALCKSDLGSAEELFLTNALIGVWPVAQLEQQAYSAARITPLICQGLALQGVSECAK